MLELSEYQGLFLTSVKYRLYRHVHMQSNVATALFRAFSEPKKTSQDMHA